jgi:hypothetical protein
MLKKAFRCGFLKGVSKNPHHNERPYIMRYRKADLKRPVKSDLTLRFETKALTSYAGLELIRRYFKQLELVGRLRRHLAGQGLDADFGAARMILLLIGLLIIGGRRLQHVLFVRDDCLLQRLCGLRSVPTPQTIGRWLRRFTARQLERLQRVNEELVAETIRGTRLGRLTIDVDGSVVSTGQKVAWAQRGFNPHHRKVPSYYPITAYEAQTGLILRVKNRPGNVHDGKGALTFLRDVFAQVQRQFGAGYRMEWRMDGAFFLRPVVELLERQRSEYAIKVPFYTWLGLKTVIQQRKRWKRINADLQWFAQSLYLPQWDKTLRVFFFRKKVHHRTRKNYQLDLFDPSDGYFEYSAVATNKQLRGKALWAFMSGRGSHERALGELKTGFAFDSVPTQHYGANSAWQILSTMAFNLMRSFQISTTAARRPRSRKRRTVYLLEAIQTMRYKWINRAATVTSPNGYATLDVGRNHEVKNRFLQIHQFLRKAA